VKWRRVPRWQALAAVVIALVATTLAAPAVAATTPDRDSFYRYAGSRPLADIAPGTVLKHRTIGYRFAGIPLPLRVTQLLYRTTGTHGEPTATVTSIIKPVVQRFAHPRLVSYQYEYDALGSQCDPSYGFNGGGGLSSGATEGEQTALTSYLLAGYTVVTSDYEGTKLRFLSAPESAHGVLDGIRAALRYRPIGLDHHTRIAMVGYSGGSFATEWAAEYQPRYAPELTSRLVGAAVGGVPVNFTHNLAYADGTATWSAVIPLALAGLARGYRIDLDPYLNAHGRAVLHAVARQCIVDVLGRYPGLTFASLMRPRYPTVESVPPLRRVIAREVMGRRTPTMPIMAATGMIDGKGDLIMVASDVRALARNYCSRGLQVTYHEYDGLEHVGGFALFIPDALTWIEARFAGRPVPNSCGHIAPILTRSRGAFRRTSAR
jgi:pimeloyl-ACP methyl ester carboxylesterase